MVKSVIEIDLRDASFQRFQSQWKKYQASVQAMPQTWQSTHNHILKSASAFKLMVATEKQRLEQVKLMEVVQRRAEISAAGMSGYWRRMAQSSKEFASNIKESSASLLRAAGVSGIIGALLGAGSLWGIDRLAANVGGGRRSSLGLGLGYGEQKSFTTNFSRFVDPGSFLGNVNQVLSSADKTPLFGAGLSQRQMGGSTAQVAVALIPALKRIADNTDPRFLADYMRARGLDRLVGLEDMVRLRGMSRGEIAEMTGRFNQDVGPMGLGADTQKKWQDLSTALTRVTEKMENTFATALVGLAPGFTKLSESVEQVIRIFGRSDTVKEWIERAGEGMKSLGEYIGTPEFKQNVETFARGIGKIAQAITNFVQWAGGGVGGPRTPIQLARANGIKLLPGEGAPAVTALRFNSPDYPTGGKTLKFAQLVELARQLEGTPDGRTSPTGAVGPWQVMPATARRFGFSDDPAVLRDPAYNKMVAEAVLKELTQTYKGDVDKILVGYNASSLTRNRFVESGGNPASLPWETQRYLERGRGMVGGPGARVEINDNTGGNINVTTSTLPH